MLTILQGDWIERLKELPDESVQMCVTSPPYWGLRDYGVAGQLGLEKTPGGFVSQLVKGFREVRRVIASDGTLWLNLGDSYAGGGNNRGNNSPLSGKQSSNGGATGQCAEHAKNIQRIDGIKSKDLIGIPWMVAFALRADGWYLRSDIIWAKPNPMPESVTDRPTRAHEYIFLLSKSTKYYYDRDAISEPFADPLIEGLRRGIANTPPHEFIGGFEIDPTNANICQICEMPHPKNGINANRSSYRRGSSSSMNNGEHVRKSDEGLPLRDAGRNKRSVWTVAPANYPDAHFATFPPALIKPCILAGSRPGDTVLDPFFGSGTTGKVALEHGRKCIGIELNPDYIKLAEKRCNVQLPLFL